MATERKFNNLWWARMPTLRAEIYSDLLKVVSDITAPYFLNFSFIKIFASFTSFSICCLCSNFFWFSNALNSS